MNCQGGSDEDYEKDVNNITDWLTKPGGGFENRGVTNWRR